MLALQSTAGNRVVAGALQRYFEKAGATKDDVPRTAKGKPNEGWVENGRDPRGAYLRREGDAWFQWSQKARKWTPVPAPVQPEQTTPPPTSTEGPTSTPPPRKEPVPPNRSYVTKDLPIKDLSSTSGMSLAGSTTDPVTLPGGALPDAFITKVFGHLDTAALLALRTTNTWFRDHGSTALREYLKGRVGPTVSGRSALHPKKTLIEQYLDTIAPRSLNQLVMVSDKVNPETITTLTEGLPRGALSVHYAEKTSRGRIMGSAPVKGPYDQHEKGAKNSKMHNKFVVGSGPKISPFLLSGSPNLTGSAMAANIESAVVVRYPGIAKLYQDYAALIARRSKRDDAFTRALEGFNERNVLGIRAALAPFVNVGKTLDTELQGADEITMRMFLVGSGKKHDVVGSLCRLAQRDAKVTVVVDRQQAATTPYVRDALDRLERSGVTIASERGKPRQDRPGESGIMHDKLVLAHYPGAGKTKERWTVMIGSSGLTRNVDQNWNYENLLVIDDKALFDWFQRHHKEAEPYRTMGLPAVEPTSDLGRATATLRGLLTSSRNGWVSATDATGALRGAGLSNSWLDDAVTELALKRTRYRGATWFG